MIVEAASLWKRIEVISWRCSSTSEHVLSMGYKPSGALITSTLSWSLTHTPCLHEWQKSTHHYKGLLEFINLRAQASEMFLDGGKKNPSADHRLCTSLHGKIFTSYTSTALLELKITLYARLKGTNYMLVLSSKIFVLHKNEVATLKSQNWYLNCLWTGHFVNHCKSFHASLPQVSSGNRITHSCTSNRQYLLSLPDTH